MSERYQVVHIARIFERKPNRRSIRSCMATVGALMGGRENRKWQENGGVVGYCAGGAGALSASFVCACILPASTKTRTLPSPNYTRFSFTALLIFGFTQVSWNISM